MNKKAVMGIGMLIIFIATVLVSAVAAGVLIKSTGLLQQKALIVEESTRERLVNGVEVFAVFGTGNVSNESIAEFEFLTRVKPGSTPVQMKNLGISFVSGSLAFSAELNDSMIGDSCTFSSLIAETQFCFDNRLGNNDTIFEEGELFAIKYKINASNALPTETDFEVTFLPKNGALEVQLLRTPQLVLQSKIRIR
ncbi:MAG: flagellin [Candidatus Woesearchaeota archaeon]|nr:flagellin [Candidatus Woesearchaeota archaeon]